MTVLKQFGIQINRLFFFFLLIITNLHVKVEEHDAG